MPFQKCPLTPKPPGRTCNFRTWIPANKDTSEAAHWIYCQKETNGSLCEFHEAFRSGRLGVEARRKKTEPNEPEPDAIQPESSPFDPNDIWEEEPVDTRTFFETFVKEPFFPIQQEFVDAMLGTDPGQWDTGYTEGVALWGKGSGKDRTAAKILTYVCYKLLCMRDPAAYFKWAAAPEYRSRLEDKIEVANVCINAHLAKAVFFKYFRQMVKNTINPITGKNWFEEQGLNLKKDILTREIKFPKNITAYSLDSEEYTGEGLNLFFVIFDEIAGFDPAKARELYAALRSTCASRFPQHRKLLLLSYKRNDTDYMMIRYDEAVYEPKTYRTRAATWEVNKFRKKEDFVDEYTRDPEGSQRVYECLGSTSEGGYIKFKGRIAEVINAAGRQSPIIGDLWRIINLRGVQFKEWFKPEPNTAYFIHVDLAKDKDGKGDACGLAMGHFKRDMPVTLPPSLIEAVKRYENYDLSGALGRRELGVVVDLVLQIKAAPGGEIIFDEIREFIKRLKHELKFSIQQVTFDGWQSTDSIQLLRKDGAQAEELSVDRNNSAYDTLKSLIYRGILEAYYHPTLIRELEELIVTNRGKVDHPDYGSRYASAEGGVIRASKDVADAVAGCIKTCIDKGKNNFQFWSSGDGEPLKDRPDLMRKMRDMYRFESEELVRHGEKPPSWYKRFPW